MANYKNTYTWKNSLGLDDSDHADAIKRLASIFEDMREKVTHLANEIGASLPDFTVHDITHIDSLWEMADVVCGEDYPLNPVEGFILGGAFLLHDVAMSIQAYPNGLQDLEALELWSDTVVQRCYQLGINPPSSFRSADLSSDLRNYTVSTLLRKLHAESAEKIVSKSWRFKADDSQVYLINDPEIRVSLGKVIGKIAHSHWWGIDKLEEEFARSIGAPGWCDRSWKIDTLKIACILRAADATHIDSRRAPSFLRTIRKLNHYSDGHWTFQEKLSTPYLRDETLYYSSASSFTVEETSAWWLCVDALKMIDKELRQVDALLSDKQMPRFEAKRVFGVESPDRLRSIVATEGWEPIDANVHIGDIPKIIKTLGGHELYGNNLLVPLRELIQNCSDAIRARRNLEGRSSDWGKLKSVCKREKIKYI
ncbi:hypothetical protein [Vibrio mexicanus]|uniref:HD domain-containing protein n=1 Tax=Vibrio mexicanus TaxID=1004326 RepID=UPI00063CAD61|nr:hypothetical protein [Vibrio mexicanus]